MLRILLLTGLIVAVAGYFGPWVWHPAVAFRYSADDLSEFVKFMPAVRSGQTPIARELFFMPIWLASVGAAVWLGSFARQRLVRWPAGLLVVYTAIWPMPMYPFILDAYRSAEFGPSFWGSVAAAALSVIALALGARLPDRARAGAWMAIGLAGAIIAPLTFAQIKPALDAQHGWMLSIGWGIAAVLIGFIAVAAAGVAGWVRATRRQ